MPCSALSVIACTQVTLVALQEGNDEILIHGICEHLGWKDKPSGKNQSLPKMAARMCREFVLLSMAGCKLGNWGKDPLSDHVEPVQHAQDWHATISHLELMRGAKCNSRKIMAAIINVSWPLVQLAGGPVICDLNTPVGRMINSRYDIGWSKICLGRDTPHAHVTPRPDGGRKRKPTDRYRAGPAIRPPVAQKHEWNLRAGVCRLYIECRVVCAGYMQSVAGYCVHRCIRYT